ncbi:hypothetical protein QFZ64_000138 [Streptomyces sp. B3I8]|nr:hypothetical protein [Streptomyces sp. B3I8]
MPISAWRPSGTVRAKWSARSAGPAGWPPGFDDYAERKRRGLAIFEKRFGLSLPRATARFQVNHAQVERSRQAREDFDRTSPVAPAVRAIDRSVEFLDLVTACHSFVAAAGRTVPGLRDRTLNDDERTLVHENLARVRATLDWIETAVDTGKVDVDDELARLLKGE